ncbi:MULTISPECIES: HlyD family secretion protein [Vibrio]|uniref:HlyD family efflux transporter periplasmic adaptor subunit n=1 Tax=Vibrio aestuarianus TaxID=28171 RepID=A0A9X4F8W2_9VIBR|nr:MULTISPECIES: HlyD family secretion protein [Vibrio]MDE1234453.1 HlyD family efflux transporter periplasmic adaptor subunit [Vibrio aestuarianus]MDE1245311.1 HlyD family efflux transporter periplasmic adaptor subunit [Vibrio aestuarianus]MDE1336674.1 HlyD family efflux transporter periplasmic adaptor subunit [Vibrio aestuarianus]MDE1345685.1 HlyD family efflux transporter periplasmic adaptor subunit [Vibrio aestuarianus]MDF9399393.1 HlyD family secretion protein [Vibrio sp. 1180_3]
MKVQFHLDKQIEPQSESGIKVVYGQAKRGGYRFRWYLLLALVISPAIAMLYHLYRDNIMIIAPGIITSHPVELKTVEDGVVGPVGFVIGSPIESKQPILTVTNQSLSTELKFLTSEINRLDVHLNESFDIHRQAIAASEKNVEEISAIRKRYDIYKAKGQVSDVDYAAIVNLNNSANNELNSRKMAFNDAQNEYQEQLLAGSVSQARRFLLKELVVKSDRQKQLTINSPYDGRIVDIAVVEGQQVVKGETLVTVAKNIKPQVIAYLNPKYLSESKIGQKTTVRFSDGKKFQAVISEAVEIVSKLPIQLTKPFEGQPSYMKVVLSFNDDLEVSRWIEGMSVEVIF